MTPRPINHPSYFPSSAEPRYMAYDDAGSEYGFLTLSEAREKFAVAVIETDDNGSKTITVERA